MICLNGGPSHIDMYDMKPLAPAEVRGEFQPIPTNVPGLDVCELMPLQATIADQFSIVRSLRMIQPNHDLDECYTGFPTDLKRPAFGSAVSKLRENEPSPLPKYVSLSLSDHPRTAGKAEVPTYAGLAHAPFEPSSGTLENLQPHASISSGRFADRKSLLSSFDQLRRRLAAGGLEGADEFAARAMEILGSNGVRDAFDITREPEHVRELYGPDTVSPFNYQFGHTWKGSDFLLARRLVEAGVPVVTFAPGAWDHHGNLNGVRGTIFERMRERLPQFDRSLYALLTDIRQRGLEREIAVVVWGEFGRTPRVNKYGGRDHWTPANFALFAGGGMKTGQVIGATDAQGAQITTPPYGAQNVMATIYRLLGIDPASTLTNFSGRPVPLLEDPQPISALL